MDVTAPVPAGAGELGDGRRRWREDPRFSLEMLSPGQRYTALIVGALAVAMLTIGVPRGSGSVSEVPSNAPTGAAAEAGLTRPAATAASPAPAPVVETAPATSEAAVLTSPSSGLTYESAPPPPPSSSPEPAPAPAGPSSASPSPAAPAAPAPAPIPALPVPVPGLGK